MNTFGSRSSLRVGSRQYDFFRISSLDKHGFQTARLPYSLRILLENLLRREDGVSCTAEMIRALASWTSKTTSAEEISFMPSRVLLQDFTGVPAIVDLAAMRDAMARLGGDAKKINPLQPAELVIDHSVQVDEFGTPQAFDLNAALEFQRNQERYAFLRWGQSALKNFAIVPPDTGIVHQVNLEYLARVVFVLEENGKTAVAYPDTLVGTDSHTTMVNGLGVLGWGVGGIEAEAAMLGQAASMLIPQVVGVRFTGKLREGSTATDLVLTVTEVLRKKGVVGKFVEYFGPSLGSLTLADRATIANMAPEYGATCGIFPVDEETLRYLRLTGRSDEQIALVEAYYKEQGLFHSASSPEAEYTDVLHIDLGAIEPSIAGPKRPQDRVELSQAAASFAEALPALMKPDAKVVAKTAGRAERDSKDFATALHHGSVVIAAITSCTNTSNPYVLVAAGLLAKKAVEKGLKCPAWVKTSLAPGSKVVTEYLNASGLQTYLDQLGFNLVGYGCTTCIGNSGPLPQEVSDVVAAQDLVVASVLSGNRNFEGRINSEVRANYLMSPPLVVAFALAGEMIDMYKDPIGNGNNGPVYLKDIWPTQKEVDEIVHGVITAEMFRGTYADVLEGDARWRGLKVPAGDTYSWDANSTYIQNPPYFEGMAAEPKPVAVIKGARVLARFGHSVTTDHISPAGSIKKDSPAGKYLMEYGVKPVDFNSYGSRRGNHEVMMRGTFANTRIRNKLVPHIEGGYTKHIPSGKELTIYDAAMQYRSEGTPVIVIAGKEYGSGSSRDWAAKGPLLLGVRAVIAESFERIHRSNLVGMGILPLQFLPEQNPDTVGITGEESYEIVAVDAALANFAPGKTVEVKATAGDGSVKTFKAMLRIDTPQEVLYYQHGGILQYVIRQLLRGR
ncbi:MAG: aconitate hydratase AcnA [Acidobacteria bacterium]|nr:MAG: aconitate hydratase AcnA [Acidobacteriota bacterium]